MNTNNRRRRRHRNGQTKHHQNKTHAHLRQPIYGFYGSGHNTRAPCRLTLLGEPSFESTANEERQRSAGQGARFEECRAMGYVKNVNTKEVGLVVFTRLKARI